MLCVDLYLQSCVEDGKEPDTPFKGVFNVRLDPELHRRVAEMAMEEDLSLNAFVNKALEKRSQQSSRRGLNYPCFLCPVRAWEALCAGSPAAQRGLKKRYGFSRNNSPAPARPVFFFHKSISYTFARWSKTKEPFSNEIWAYAATIL